ncbi:MAG TPA: hypothetical protein VH681_10215, partial [Nitrospiraceae bacterium]
MTARDLIQEWAARLTAEQQQATVTGLDDPITSVSGKLCMTSGALHLYELTLPRPTAISIDTPVTIVPQNDMEPTEGIVLGNSETTLLVQAFDSIGHSFVSATVVPDRAGILATSVQRLTEMITETDTYRLGPADR